WDSQIGDVSMSWLGLIVSSIIIRNFKIPSPLARDRNSASSPELVQRLGCHEIMFLIGFSFTHLKSIVKGTCKPPTFCGHEYPITLLKRWAFAVFMLLGMLLGSGPCWILPDEMKFASFALSAPIQILMLYLCHNYVSPLIQQDLAWTPQMVKQYFYVFGGTYLIVGFCGDILPFPTYFGVWLTVLCICIGSYYVAPKRVEGNPQVYGNGQLKCGGVFAAILDGPDVEEVIPEAM
ncbi:hypothetical protein KIPB_010076, partial [Kipferlia bialata]